MIEGYGVMRRPYGANAVKPKETLDNEIQTAKNLGVISDEDIVAIEPVDLSNQTWPYVVIAKTPADLDSLEFDITNQTSGVSTVPDRCCSLADSLPDNATSTIFRLTWIEAIRLRKDNRVLSVTLLDNPYDSVETCLVDTRDFTKPSSSGDTSLNQRNFALIRCTTSTNVYGTSNFPYGQLNGVATYSNNYDGEGLDAVIQDNGVRGDHPEFLDNEGNSRFVYYDWFRELSNATFAAGANSHSSSNTTTEYSTGLFRIDFNTENVQYDVPPTVTIEPPWKVGGTQATINLTWSSGILATALIDNAGSGYTPEISFVGGGGAGATAFASYVLNGGVYEIQVENQGTGYTSPPTVVITGRTGSSGATGQALVQNGKVVAVRITATGTNYSPTVNITGGTVTAGKIGLSPRNVISENNYVVPALNSSFLIGAMPNGYYFATDVDHGTHVASTVAGKTFGWARKSKIYSLKMIGQSTINASFTFLLLGAFQQKKNSNPEPGKSYGRPTVVNASWSSTVGFTLSFWSVQGFVFGTDTMNSRQIKAQTYRGVRTNSTILDFDKGFDAWTGGSLTDHNVNVTQTINGKTYYNFRSAGYQNSGYDTSLADLLTNPNAEGLYFVKAAGNDGRRVVPSNDLDYENTLHFYNGSTDSSDYYLAYPINKPPSPDAPLAVIVGSSNALAASASLEMTSPYTNYGSRITLYAPGTYIVAAGAYSGSTYDLNAAYKTLNNSGTSMASPQVAGVGLLFVQRFIEKNNRVPTRTEFLDFFSNSTFMSEPGGAYTNAMFDPGTLSGLRAIGSGGDTPAPNKFLFWPYANEVLNPPVTINLFPASLPEGYLTVNYNQTITSSGGTDPYSYSISSGTLPAGLTLNSSTGVISGIPTSEGTFNFTVVSTDNNSNTGSKNYSIVINGIPVINITPETLPNGQQTISYSQTLVASGGIGAYAYTISAGALPNGLSLNSSTGVISGTPTFPSTYSFTARATDSLGFFGERSYSIVIINAPIPQLEILPETVPAGVRTYPYINTFTVGGGTGPYNLIKIAGTEPTGLIYNTATLTISGTPTVGGNFNYTLRATDAEGRTKTKSYTHTILGDPTFTFLPDTLSTATAGFSYTSTITVSASPSFPPFYFEKTVGTLPTGLSLNTNTRIISGIPTITGTNTFTVFASDTLGFSETKEYSITVIPPSITLSPTILVSGTNSIAYSATLVATGGTSPYSYGISGGALPTGLTLNSSSGVISGIPATIGSFAFTVRATDAYSFTGEQAYTLDILTAPPPVFVFSPVSLPSGYTYRFYYQPITITGGTQPYILGLGSGTLPVGIEFNTSTRIISGITNTVTTNSFIINLTDINGFTSSTSYTLKIDPSPNIVITPPTLPNAKVFNTYTQVLSASGGTSPYTFVLNTGTLPVGLTFTNNTITGTPIALGTSSFAFKVTDAQLFTASIFYSLSVDSNIEILPNILQNGKVGTAYYQLLTSTNSSMPVRWNVEKGRIPPGTVLNENHGTISGIPSAKGNFDFMIKIIDSNQIYNTINYNVEILPIDAKTTNTSYNTSTNGVFSGWKNTGTIGTLYTEETSELSVSAFISTSTIGLKYELQAGTLPNGLSLIHDGSIVGIPIININTSSQISTSSFQIKAVDNFGNLINTNTFNIVVVQNTNTSFTNLYFTPLLSRKDRNSIATLLQNSEIFQEDILYRPFDSNFGVQKTLKLILHYGIEIQNLEEFANMITKNFYKRAFLLSTLKSAIAKDYYNNVNYEVIYIDVLDKNLPNQDINSEFTFNGVTYYPSNIESMRERIIETGNVSNVRDPKFLKTIQKGDNVKPGYFANIPICYTKEGKSDQIIRKINSLGFKFNDIRFEVDRLWIEKSGLNAGTKYLLLNQNPKIS